MFNNYYMNTFFNRKTIEINGRRLDKYQTRAVLCKKDKYLTVAGAGSGKTLTIVAKIKYLIESGFKEKDILCISFTNETVNSLKKSLDSNGYNIDVKTFHKLSLDIIKNKHTIAPNDLLEYTTNEYFNAFVYFDNSYKLLDYIDNNDDLKNTITTFINQMKGQNYDISFILSLLNNIFISKDDKIVLAFILKVYILYEEELKSENKIDFNDMINLAIKEISNINYFQYKYIIIDEYQDTSQSKYNLINKLINKFNCKLMAVGDDYQSIYSFTGCNLSLFTKFKKYFKNSKIIKLKNVYRNPSDITIISKRFVMKNRHQINKKLKSNKYVSNSITIVYSNDDKVSFSKIIESIDNILILGRNNKDIEVLKEDSLLTEVDNKLVYKYDKNKNIRFLTVHKSKGLEEENIIILNVVDSVLGFPNKIKSNNVLNYLRNYNYFEEERRLFYVALTRAKEKVFIFTKRNQESIFIKELLKDFKKKIKVVDLTKNL